MITSFTFSRYVICKADHVNSGTQDIRNHSPEKKRIPSPSGGRPGRGDRNQAVFLFGPLSPTLSRRERELTGQQ
jgi:hypothetical protein